MALSKNFKGVARFDEAGELVCFCYEQDIESGKCGCLGKHLCYNADFQIDLIKAVEPDLVKIEKDFDRASKKIASTSKKIREGLLGLENAMKKNKFRF